MTDRPAPTNRHLARRRAATIALLPAVAGVFGGSLAWAGSHDPLSSGQTGAAPSAASSDGRSPAEALAAQVQDAQRRLAALEASLAQSQAAQSGAAQGAAADNQSAQAPAAAPAPAPAPAPAAPPPVHVTTRASG